MGRGKGRGRGGRKGREGSGRGKGRGGRKGADTSRLTVEAIYHSVVSSLSDQPAAEEPSTPSDDPKNAVERVVKVVELEGKTASSASSDFEAAIHLYGMFGRPAAADQVRALAGLVARIARLCEDDAHAWKMFMLNVIFRRYHARAPAAKETELGKRKTDSTLPPRKKGKGGKGSKGRAGALRGGDDSDGSDETEDDEEPGDGDGERLLFYITILALEQLARGETDTKLAARAHTAADCLSQLAVDVGGTRDVGALCEYLGYADAVQCGLTDALDAPQPESSKAALLPLLLRAVPHAAYLDAPERSPLRALLRCAAGLLDADLSPSVEDAESRLLSTMHVFLPHHERGNSHGSSWRRYLTQTVCELLIWSSTECMAKDNGFADALDRLRVIAAEEGGDSASKLEQVRPLLLKLQTIIRKRRQQLNSASRSLGFSLCQSFFMDPTTITYRMVCRAKAGDLQRLEKLAKKKRDARVLRLIAKRGLSADKAVPALSVQTLIEQFEAAKEAGWLTDDLASLLPATGAADGAEREASDDAELVSLERQLLLQTVKATIGVLRQKVGKSVSSRPLVCVGHSHQRTELVASVLVAASLHPSKPFADVAEADSTPSSRPSVCLLLGGIERDVSTDRDVLGILLECMFDHDDWPLVNVDEFLEETVTEGLDALLFCETDIELDERGLKKLQERDQTLHVHRTIPTSPEHGEKVRIQLAATIVDQLKAGTGFSLSVLLDCTGSMGSEIDGCKKGALEMLKVFADLAPVHAANFLGYWDQPGSSGDSAPASTGFVSLAGPESRKQVQDFVNKSLVCAGGGDEPEDIPAAFDHFRHDFEAFLPSAPSPILHLVFLIADAGFRPDENARMRTLCEWMQRQGIVFVMCPVRGGYNGGTLGACTELIEQTFIPYGQYVKVGGVGQLAAIAKCVTGAIRASLTGSSNLVAVTSSTGETLDSLVQLCRLSKDHAELTKIKELTKSDTEEKASEAGERPMEVDRNVKIVATKGRFEITAAERRFLQLSRLPAGCQEVVQAAFGGESLLQRTAQSVAQRMLDSNSSVDDLVRAGYPEALIQLVKERMRHH